MNEERIVVQSVKDIYNDEVKIVDMGGYYEVQVVEPLMEAMGYGPAFFYILNADEARVLADAFTDVADKMTKQDCERRGGR